MKQRAQTPCPASRRPKGSAVQILCILVLLPFVVFAAPLDRFVQLPECCRSGCNDDGCPIGASRLAQRDTTLSAHGHPSARATRGVSPRVEAEAAPGCHGEVGEVGDASAKSDKTTLAAPHNSPSPRTSPRTEAKETTNAAHPRLAWTNREKCPQECCGTTSAQRLLISASGTNAAPELLTRCVTLPHETQVQRAPTAEAQPRGPPIG